MSSSSPRSFALRSASLRALSAASSSSCLRAAASFASLDFFPASSAGSSSPRLSLPYRASSAASVASAAAEQLGDLLAEDLLLFGQPRVAHGLAPGGVGPHFRSVQGGALPMRVMRRTAP
ncbi:hypothetical protein D7003_02635 [Arthrobacter oryzae]|uniref:Uncharacterized protein n=1 Tax=Arthrobacter oryzae TaxID=409290 RepID=A0A3N0C8D2_9MICC|nr:hypothetical protein D7003_02635 [Arthrobacter oryzae]